MDFYIKIQVNPRLESLDYSEGTNARISKNLPPGINFPVGITLEPVDIFSDKPASYIVQSSIPWFIQFNALDVSTYTRPIDFLLFDHQCFQMFNTGLRVDVLDKSHNRPPRRYLLEGDLTVLNSNEIHY